MLNAKALGELLTKNRDERLCKRWSVMTPNGTLLAYSETNDIKSLRLQSAVAALAWQEHHGSLDSEDETAGSTAAEPLQTLTIETDACNLFLRRLQPRLILVLEGGVPPRKGPFEARVTPETLHDAPYPLRQPEQNGSDTPHAGSTASGAAHGALLAQRRKLDAMAAAIAQHLDRAGFRMPDDDGVKLF